MGGFAVFMQWYAVSSIGYGGSALLFVEPLVVLSLLAPALAVPGLLVGALFPSIRRRSLVLLVGCCLFVVVGVGALRVGGPIRMAGFDRLAERSKPLVAAITDFTREQGRPPIDLHELVPTYLPEVPGTGMPAYPDFDYATDPQRWDANPWTLWVRTPAGGINFDMFMYLPRQNYPEQGYGGVLVRVGDWAYVYE
jgi:hypothetical protein